MLFRSKNTSLNSKVAPILNVDPMECFAHSYQERKDYLSKFLLRAQKNEKKVAIFGAGHLAIKFINFYNISKFITCVIDDDINKNNMYLPGSNLQITSSAVLDNNQIDYCLLALSPESEIAVRRAKQSFLRNGGKFFSIFSGAESSIFGNVVWGN